MIGVPAGSLFVVGDPKQSIYRFRRADIATYLHAQHHLGENLVLGTGRSPRIPSAFGPHMGPYVFHSSSYLGSIRRLSHMGNLRVAVVGSSQSAIEIVLDLLDRPNVEQVISINRGIGFRLKDTSPYSRQAYLPEFVDYFHPLPKDVKRRLRDQLKKTLTIQRVVGREVNSKVDLSDDALRLMMYAAARKDELITIEETAKLYGLSRAHLMKVANQLTRAGFLKAVRGRGGA